MIAVPCFFKNTMILTPHGCIRVNDLQVGDLVKSSGEKFAPVKFVGKRNMNKTAERWEAEVEPIIVKGNAFGDGTPTRDLIVSPEHAFFLDGLFYKASELVNDSTIVRMGETPINEIEYFHIDLGFHDLVFAEGAAAESFGGATREHFDNCDEFYRLYGKETNPYTPFATYAFKFKRSAAKLGNIVSGKLPKVIHDLGKPFARKVYNGAGFIEKRLSRKTDATSNLD